jgi:hypothetical protein
VEIDAAWFMEFGGGRFMHPGRFEFVKRFLRKDPNDLKEIELMKDFKASGLSVKRYTGDDLLTAYGVINDKRKRSFGLLQYEYEQERIDEFKERCMVFGSSEFYIHDKTEFEIHANGDRVIYDLGVQPVDDNFDFESDTLVAKLFNFYAKPIIDPKNYGKAVKIKFTNLQNINLKPRVTYLPALEREEAELMKKKKSSFSDENFKRAYEEVINGEIETKLRMAHVLYYKRVFGVLGKAPRDCNKGCNEIKWR